MTDTQKPAANDPSGTDRAAPGTSETIARLRAVSRRYGSVRALDGIDLQVRRGELLGLLGPNGAGKSTLVGLLTGLRKPTAGTVEVFGADPRLPSSRQYLGVTPQETALPPTLRVAECVDFVSRHFEHPVERGELLARFGLSDLTRRQTGSLSGGQKRRLAVALAFAGNPRLVLLDEPTTGLDVQARRALWDGIRTFHAEGGSILLTSHYLPEVEELAERVVVLADGRLIADGNVESVRGMVRLQRITVTVDQLPDLGQVRAVTRDPDGRAQILTSDADRAVRSLVASGVPFSGLQIEQTSLEDAFLALVNSRCPEDSSTNRKVSL